MLVARKLDPEGVLPYIVSFFVSIARYFHHQNSICSIALHHMYTIFLLGGYFEGHGIRFSVCFGLVFGCLCTNSHLIKA